MQRSQFQGFIYSLAYDGIDKIKINSLVYRKNHLADIKIFELYINIPVCSFYWAPLSQRF